MTKNFPVSDCEGVRCWHALKRSSEARKKCLDDGAENGKFVCAHGSQHRLPVGLFECRHSMSDNFPKHTSLPSYEERASEWEAELNRFSESTVLKGMTVGKRAAKRRRSEDFCRECKIAGRSCDARMSDRAHDRTLLDGSWPKTVQWLINDVLVFVLSFCHVKCDTKSVKACLLCTCGSILSEHCHDHTSFYSCATYALCPCPHR